MTLDLSKGCVMHENQSVELTKNEIRILWLLMRKQGTIVSRDEIMTDLWQSEEFCRRQHADCQYQPAAAKIGKYRRKPGLSVDQTRAGVSDMTFKEFLQDRWLFLLGQTIFLLFAGVRCGYCASAVSRWDFWHFSI